MTENESISDELAELEPELARELQCAVQEIDDRREAVVAASGVSEEWWTKSKEAAKPGSPIKGSVASIVKLPFLAGPWWSCSISGANQRLVKDPRQRHLWHIGVIREQVDDTFDEHMHHMAKYTWSHPYRVPSRAIGGNKLTLGFLKDVGQQLQPTYLNLVDIEIEDTLVELLKPKYGITEFTRTVLLSTREVPPSALARLLLSLQHLEFIIVYDVNLQKYPDSAWTAFKEAAKGARIILRRYANVPADPPTGIELDPPIAPLDQFALVKDIERGATPPSEPLEIARAGHKRTEE